MRSDSRASGLAASIRPSAWSRWEAPKTRAVFCSVTTQDGCSDVVGSVSLGTMVERLAFGCHDFNAMIACPPGDCKAPTMKSACPPVPEMMRSLTRVALTAPNRSTCSAVLMLVTAGCLAMFPGLFVVSQRSSRSCGLSSAQA